MKHAGEPFAITHWPQARWRRLRRLAMRLSRRPDEAEDLLQDTLLAAVEAGRDDERWLQGVMRRQAAFAARSAVRRSRRDLLAVEWSPQDADTHDDADVRASPPRALDALRLPPASRRVLRLALHGLGPGEIQWLLGVAPTAFRQRLTTIRRALAGLPAPLRDSLDACACAPWIADTAGHDPRSGLRRRVLVRASRQLPAMGTRDPDGHLLLVRSPAHNPGPGGNRREATAQRGRPTSRT